MDTDAGTTPALGCLPQNVIPNHYYLSLFDLNVKAPWTFQGIVDINIDILSATDRIVIHANEITVHNAEVVITNEGQMGKTLVARDITYDARNQRCTLLFDHQLPLSTQGKAKLSIKYQGTMNDHITGFYRSAYRSASGIPTQAPEFEGSHYMFSTQFQPIDARRAFPCFDEPGLKATFDFEIEIPATLTALNNMPQKAVATRQSTRPGCKTVAFERSPRMSTYLLAWAIGDFEYVEKIVKRPGAIEFPVRVYTTRGLKQHAGYGLDVGVKVVNYFSKMFQIEYPLPKLDMIVVHEMADDAMENWGLLTFQGTALLYDPVDSAASYQVHVAYIVAHEIAHQWFGNLVTPQWWDELWLNEGFATWAGWDAVDHLHPEWDIWADFVGDSMRTAFELDALSTTHPVQVEVTSDLEVDSIFDAISYKKGSSLIRMLAAYLGKDRFVEGVSRYLKAHVYGSTKGEDLWRALGVVSGQDVGSFMRTWIEEKGFPVLDIEDLGNGKVEIKQQKFLSSGEDKSDADATAWWIPLRPRLSGSTHSDSARTEPLTERVSQLEIDVAQLLAMNADQAGYYRTSFPASHLEKLATHINELSVSEQIGLISDLAALAAAGHGSATTSVFLSYLRHFRHSTNEYVWDAILSSIAHIQSVFSSDPAIAESLNRYILQLTAPIVSKFQPNFFQPSRTLDHDLQNKILTVAGLAGHKQIITQAKTLAYSYLSGNDTKALNPSLRSAAFELYLHHSSSTPSAMATLAKAYETTSSLDGKEILLGALGQVPTPEAARDVLRFTFQSGKVDMQNLPHVAEGLEGNRDSAVRGAVWEFVKENWEEVFGKLEGSIVVLDRFMQVVVGCLIGDGMKEDVETFFAGRDVVGFGRGLRVGLDTLGGNQRYKERDGAELKMWTKKEGYLE